MVGEVSKPTGAGGAGGQTKLNRLAAGYSCDDTLFNSAEAPKAGPGSGSSPPQKVAGRIRECTFGVPRE